MNRRLFTSPIIMILLVVLALLSLAPAVQGVQISPATFASFAAEPSPTALPAGADGSSTTDANIIAAPASCTGSSCTILATTGWQQTPLTLQQGTTFSVLYTSGTWTIDYRNFPYVDPNGYSADIDNQIVAGCKVDGSLPYARLLGQIGSGQAFSVGAGGTFTANASGVLALRINDHDTCLGDNDGAIVLQVQAGFSCANVTEIPTSECNALVALYNSTNGPNWIIRSDWLATTTPCSWYGVACDNNHVAQLILYNNQLSGNIPSQLGNLTKLTWLGLSNNQLSGNILPELGNLTNLAVLFLGANELSGNIPGQLGNLANLTTLVVGYNQLSGNIPPELGNLTNLNWLDVGVNQLSGNMPTQLTQLTNLSYLNVSGNQLSGNIPLQLGNLIDLTELYLNDNQFVGALPGTLTNLNNLATFWFHNTSLCEPGDSAFQNWLASIANLQRTSVCPPDITVQFGAPSFTVNENGQVLDFRVVTLSATPSQAVTVRFTTSNGTATAGSDYTAQDVILTFNPGETSKSFNVPILQDNLDENDETVNLTLSTPTNATLGTLVNAALTIFDDDPLPTVQFSSANYSINENGGSATIQVTLSTAPGRTVAVNYATSNGSATAGSDYQARSGAFSFNPGETTKTFTMPINNDNTVEPDETVNLTLSSPGNADLGAPANAILTIINDDNTPPVANNQNVTTVQNTAVNITLIATDADNDPLMYIIVSNPSHGTLSGAPPNLIYTPSGGFSGSDSFRFKVNDGKADSNIATVSITVTPTPCYILTTGVSPANGGTVVAMPSPNCQGNKYTQGTVVSLTATGNPGYVFSQWSGSTNGTQNPLTVTMDGDKNITANFTLLPPSSISGRVIDTNNNPIPDVTITDGAGHTATTDTSGNYTLSDLAAGSYTLTPSKSSYTFAPTSRTITVPPNATGVDFTGTQLQLCGTMDVAFVVDTTTSMGEAINNVKTGLAQILASIEIASNNDYRLALVTFRDDISIRENFASNNRASIEPKFQGLSLSGGGQNEPEASDEALNTVVNALPATGRPQNINFTPAFRAEALKVIILVTDARPGGFGDAFTPGVDDANAHNRAIQASAQQIKISAVFVPTGFSPANHPTARSVMQDYAGTTNGVFIETASNGGGTSAAINNIIARCGTTFSISGKVIDANGNAISDVTITDGAGHTATANASGAYTLSGVAENSYTLTPSKSDYTFSPASRTVAVPPNATEVNFVGTNQSVVPPLIDAAELVAQGDYTTVAPGETVRLWINVRNSGNTTWRAGDGYGWRGTGEWSGRSDVIWRDVPPGDVVSFTEDITAPNQPAEYTYGFILQHLGKDFGPHFFIKVTVKLLPVVLVHGWNDTATPSWDDYVEKFLPSIGLTGYAVNSMYTGSGGGTPLSIDENAQRLAGYIAMVKQKTGAKRVDIVAHSMGGLIARRYIAKYMKAGPPDVNQLIMLGTPNAGSKTADALELGGTLLDLAEGLGIPRFFPPAKELTTDFVEQFNHDNPVPGNVRFYAIAGNYSCSSLTKLPSSNPIEPDPDDVVVWRESVFAIALHGRWTYPSQQSAGCEGDHRGMRSNAVNDGGQVIFSLFVSPLLRGQIPATPPELQTVAGQQTDASQIGQPQAVATTQEAIQFTNVQTSTLQPGGRLEFSRVPEPGANVSFIVVGQPDQMVVSLRDPNGQVITPNTTDPNVQYMQMDEEFMPVTSYTISNPVPGIWTTIVEANPQTSADGVGVAAFGSLVSDLRLTLPVAESIPVVLQVVNVTAQLHNGDTPLVGANVNAQLIFPNGTVTSITLLDDGLHGDRSAGDGLYGYQFTPMIPGVYSAFISAEGVNGDITFHRSAVWATQVDGNQVFLPAILRR